MSWIDTDMVDDGPAGNSTWHKLVSAGGRYIDYGAVKLETIYAGVIIVDTSDYSGR
jgi:hypothetical protein